MMDQKFGSLTVTMLLVLLGQSVQSFFFPQFLRRQAFAGNGPPPVPGRPPGPPPGRRDESGFQVFKRPRAATNILTQQAEDSQNFHVPPSLCLACGNFPWTPVAGKEVTGAGGALSVPLATSVSTGTAQNLKQRPDFHDFPVHQHLQVTREPGNTVVINALSPEIQDRGRKPFAFNFGAPEANTVNALPPSGQPSPAFGSPIVVPYDQGKINHNGDTPRQPSASSLAPGYAQPPTINYKPGLYGSNTAPIGSTVGYSKPILPPTHPQNLGPITVGTILAAQQSYQIQPAKLVYQEHSTSRQPSIFMPLPPRPPSFMQAPSPAASVPQSYKLPILPPSSGTAGSFTLNQIPVQAVPNYGPAFVPQSGYAFPVPSLQFYPAVPAQRQPKPGYGFGSFESNRYHVAEQQSAEQVVLSRPDGEGQGFIDETIDDLPPVFQRPIPPLRPYTPPQAPPSSGPPIQFHSHDQDSSPPVPVHPRDKISVSPTPTYIPPRVTGQQFTTYAHVEPKPQTTNDLEETKSSTDDAAFPALEFMPSQNSHVKVVPDQPPKNDDIDFYRHKTITIPNLLKIQQAYRFLDESPVPNYRPVQTVTAGHPPPVDGTTPGPTRQTLKEVESTTSAPVVTTVPLPNPDVTTETKASDNYGAFEVVPATQYDITHLFRGQSSNKKAAEPAPKPFPVPVPVPISEAEVANSKSPLFIIDPVGNNQDFEYGPTYEEKQQLYANNFHRQMFYDPLPPAVISALQHAQSTSLLTHQHLGDHGPKENTVYVNSIPVVSDSDDQFDPQILMQTHQKRILKPIAFDLNSGKEIEIQSNRNAEIVSLQTVLDADADAEQRKSIPVFTLQHESSLKPLATTTADIQGAADQSAVNCQNSPQWTVGPDRAPSEESVDKEVASGQKPFVFYYPSQGGAYWIPQPVSPSQDKKLVYGQELERIIESDPTTTTTQQPNLDHKETAAVNTYLAKPVLKWSKVVKPKVKLDGASVSTWTESSTELEPLFENSPGSNESEQNFESEDKVESESKGVEESTRLVTSRLNEDKDVTVYETVATGPTTSVVDCTTESTTTESYDPDVTTVTPKIQVATFSPRIQSRGPLPIEETRKNRTRFPGGRPTVPTFRRTTEESAVSASILMPVYRPPQTISSILAQTVKGYTAGHLTTPTEEPTPEDPGSTESSQLPRSSYALPPVLSTVEDDEADDLQTQNTLGEVATGRKISSFLPSSFHSMTSDQDKSTTPVSKVVFSFPILPTTVVPPVRSTKVVKTVRVRQRIRPSYLTTAHQQRLKMTGASRVRVMSRAGTADYVRAGSSPTGDILGDDEQKEVKKAQIEIKRVSNT